MPNWILKAAVQKAISFLPYKEDINFFFQKHVTRGVDLDDTHFGYKLAAARDHIRYYRNDTIRTEARIMDATRLDAADNTFDFICSNNTFEHIYTPVLHDILREC